MNKIFFFFLGQGMLSGITKTIEGAIETPLKIVNDIMSPDEVDGETSGINNSKATEKNNKLNVIFSYTLR